MLSSVDVGVPCGGMPIGSGADCGFGSRRAREGALPDPGKQSLFFQRLPMPTHLQWYR